MITTLLMTLEGSVPEVSRCVNVDDSMDLGTLAQVIDAAFGFSGAATHLYTTGAGELRQVFTEAPGAGESDETAQTVSKFTELTYIYDPTANWNIHVEVLGYSQLDTPAAGRRCRWKVRGCRWRRQRVSHSASPPPAGRPRGRRRGI